MARSRATREAAPVVLAGAPVNWRDRELLRRAAEADRGLGYFVLELLHHGDGGELPAEGMRALGQRYREIGDEMLHRAEELPPGTARWWRSDRDQRVHAWPVPPEPPHLRKAVCGRTAWATEVTRRDTGEPCFDCADLTDALSKYSRWVRE